MTTELRERLARAVEDVLEATTERWMKKWVGPAGIADDAPDMPNKTDAEPAKIVDAIVSELTAAGYAVVQREAMIICDMWPVYNEARCTKAELVDAMLKAAEDQT